NLNALTDEEARRYLASRRDHGFNAVMFTLNFAPQGEEQNAYGEAAYQGPHKTDLNPQYFQRCDRLLEACAAQGLYVMVYSMWAGEKAGTMNRYTAEQLAALGAKLGARLARHKHVILIAGGESSPPYIEAERVSALGAALKAAAPINLVAAHPCSERSSSQAFAAAPWLDFYMAHVKSGLDGDDWDAAKYIAEDFATVPTRPTMIGEHRYESGVDEPPALQRRALYQSLCAGAAGYAYGHNALWQMTPHAAAPWMLRNWNPGVAHWSVALSTPAVSQLCHVHALLEQLPGAERLPDQSLVLRGQGQGVADRVQACRDGTLARADATYVMAYVTAPQEVELDTSVIASPSIDAWWFDPATGKRESIAKDARNGGSLALPRRTQGHDWIAVIEAAAPAAADAPRP
ncbi:MAG TPA: DUF4038 domain-containing protein, partial [Lacipirellulaceae bacterium]|nr:DUF4038 domain-containing protein [Lacipirellulaceae bacterium]